MTRKKKVIDTPIGNAIRVTAIAYKADGQDARAEGMVDAANRIDGYLTKLGVEITEEMIKALGLPTEPVPMPTVWREVSIFEDHERRIHSLEESIKDLVVCIRMNETPRPAEPKPEPIGKAAARVRTEEPREAPAPKPSQPTVVSRNDGLSRPERRLLHTLIQRGKPTSTKQLAALAGYAFNGNVRSAMAALRAAGYVVGPGEANEVTKDGIAAAGTVEAMPKGQALLEHCCAQVSQRSASILRVLAHDYPKEVERPDLIQRIGCTDNGNVRTAIGALRKRGYVDKRRLRATDELMEGVRA
jgi:hypothetical protein